MSLGGDTFKTRITGIAEVDLLFANAKPETRRPGQCFREIMFRTDRLLFDCELDATWEQFDTAQDASYFGIWLNKTARRVLTYAEGDLTLVECQDAPTYDTLISKLCDCHREVPFMITVDPEGTTRHFQGRSQFYIDRPTVSGQ